MVKRIIGDIEMSSCKLCFSMDTSYGGKWELAMDSDRQWWCREYGYNGYGRGWSSWRYCEPSAVKFATITIKMHDGSVLRDRVAIVENGFSSDKRCLLQRNGKRLAQPKYRFPKRMAA